MTLPIRIRLALFSGLLIAVAVFCLGSLVYLSLEADLRQSVDESLAERGRALIDEPPAGPVIETAATDVGDVFALILTPAGAVLASTEGTDAQPILAGIEIYHFARYEFAVPTDEGPQVVRVRTMPASNGNVVLTGVAFDDQRATLDSLLLKLGLALPVAVVLAFVTGWLVAGAALRPVDRMRREAEAISATELDRRLTVPPTGDELAKLGVGLNRMLERVETAVERERRLVDNASHELRTPLANLKAELDLALRQPRTADEMHAALRSAADETDRLSRLSADLLVIARAHRGRLPIRLADSDVDELVHRAVDAFAASAATAGVALEATAEPGLRAVLDEPRVRQALDNLIDNALRHAGQGGRVTVAATRKSDQLVLAVTDSGAGFTADFLAHAFEPFSRSDEGRARDAGGAGLGLPIVRAVAEAHGGSASIANGPAGGALAEMRIPT